MVLLDISKLVVKTTSSINFDFIERSVLSIR